MDAVRTLEHFGASILFANLGHSDTSVVLERIAELRTKVAEYKPGTALVLTDVKGASIDPKVLAALGEMVTANKPYVKASAVVGLTPKRDEIRQAVASLAGRDLQAFDDVEPALDWLAEQGR